MTIAKSAVLMAAATVLSTSTLAHAAARDGGSHG